MIRPFLIRVFIGVPDFYSQSSQRSLEVVSTSSRGRGGGGAVFVWVMKPRTPPLPRGGTDYFQGHTTSWPLYFQSFGFKHDFVVASSAKRRASSLAKVPAATLSVTQISFVVIFV